jgi:WD40 repeat protein
VNHIAWHPKLPDIFATLGGDGTFSFWDKRKRQRKKHFDRSSTSV